MSNRLRERPLRRVNPSGKVMWVARVTRPEGRREAYKPGWNSGKGTFLTRGEAQRAIDEYYDERYGKLTETVDAYFERWPKKHPRAARTQATNEHRVSRALDIEIEGRKLRDWPFVDLRRRHALDLLDALLREQGRSALATRRSGASGASAFTYLTWILGGQLPLVSLFRSEMTNLEARPAWRAT